MAKVQKKTVKTAKKTSRKKKESKVLIVFVIDRSGSMMICAKDVVGGFNQYIENQKKDTTPVLLTMNQFDHEFMTNYVAKDIKEVDNLDDFYLPRGSTALLDAVGRSIAQTEAYLASSKDDVKVTFVIMTDGEENSSREYTVESIKSIIAAKEAAGWIFTYLGATADAWSAGVSLGINAANVASYASKNTRGTISSVLQAYTSGSSYSRQRFSARGASAMLSSNDSKTFEALEVNLCTTPSGDKSS